MKNRIAALAGGALLTMSLCAAADDKMMMDHGNAMKSMDANSDGMISKDEYMAYHEKMWMQMKKDSNGMVDAKSMKMKHDGMMKDKM